MEAPFQIWTIAWWEVKKSIATVSRRIIPMVLVLIIALAGLGFIVAHQGLHLQDGIYSAGISDPSIAAIFKGDNRFALTVTDPITLNQFTAAFDLIVDGKRVVWRNTDRGRAALTAFQRDYSQYLNEVYSRGTDLAAAYPLWIDLQYVESELDFAASEKGQYISIVPQSMPPVPEGPIEEISLPDPTVQISREDLTRILSSEGSQFFRFTSLLSNNPLNNQFRIPSQLTPPMPLDAIALIFIFIFPLYFTAQMFTMSIMNERIHRRGEVLLSTPIPAHLIIVGKLLPYFAGMVGVCGAICLVTGAPLTALTSLFPIILFFLGSALLIGMVARSFKEVSFISLFFSTMTTMYLFVPTVFAHVHAVSLVSPLTLILFQVQGEVVSISDYLYATILFYLASFLMFYIAIVNFREEQLFTQMGFIKKVQVYIGECLRPTHPFLSLFILNMLIIPLVFMAELLFLILFFNFPLPLSLVFLLVTAALAEEVAKSIGILSLVRTRPSFLNWRSLSFSAIATGAGFLLGEKLFLIAMLTQITQSIFGTVLFLSLQSLWVPLLLHVGTVIIFAGALRFGGSKGVSLGLILATALHSTYNLSLVWGWIT